MRVDDLVFVTSNLGKLREAAEVLGVQLDHRALDIEEIQSLDLEAVVRHKAAAAQERIGRPVLVEDTSLELVGLGGFPGPLVRWLLSSVGPAGIARIAEGFGDRRAVVRCMACARNGSVEHLGLGVVEGTIATAPRGKRGFGWDSVFCPTDGGGRTYAEMEPEEKNSRSHRRLALVDLATSLRAGSS
jgi:non-canonical purine NTP pyrophosphatase (RdgB/HAM1 family)